MQAARRMMAAQVQWPTACGRGCGRVLEQGDDWVIGHVRSRATYPHLTWVPSNWRIECRPCSDASAQSVVIEKARVEGARRAHVDEQLELFPVTLTPGQAPPLPFSPPSGQSQPVQIPERMSWDAFVRSAPAWLSPYLELDENSNPPLAISPLHPDAVGTYADQAIPWIEKVESRTQGRPVRLRWWQRLGVALKLQHDADGRLLKNVVVETGPRRAGKSVGIRGMALWRLEHGERLFGERQEIIHCGSELPVCRKAQKQAWSWAIERWGKKAVRKVNGQEEIERPLDESVWKVVSQENTYGWDTTLGLVDEGWNVKPDTVDEGIEPSLLGRASPQLVLTSTSHRRARSTMRARLADGLVTADPGVLVLWWGAPPGADISDPAVWRAASPYWDEDRAAFVASMYAKALRGEEDPELDDPDPMRGFAAQYCNLWDLGTPVRRVRGTPAIDSQTWDRLAVPTPAGVPDVVAVESWFDGGVTVAAAWREGEAVTISAAGYDHVDEAAQAVSVLGPRRTLAGADIADHPAWNRYGVRVTATKGTMNAAAADLDRLLAEGILRHTGAAQLTDQVAELHIVRSADGVRVSSTGRGDAIKAAVWAAAAARTATRRRKVLLPTG